MAVGPQLYAEADANRESRANQDQEFAATPGTRAIGITDTTRADDSNTASRNTMALAIQTDPNSIAKTGTTRASSADTINTDKSASNTIRNTMAMVAGERHAERKKYRESPGPSGSVI